MNISWLVKMILNEISIQLLTWYLMGSVEPIVLFMPTLQVQILNI